MKLVKHFIDYSKGNALVFRLNEAGHVQIEKFKYERHAVGKQQVLTHKLELIYVIYFEVFEK